MQDNTDREIGVSDILKTFQAFLKPSKITFESQVGTWLNMPANTEGVLENSETKANTLDEEDDFEFIQSESIPVVSSACPIYYQSEDKNTLVLPPSSIEQSTSDSLHATLAKILSAQGVKQEDFAGKNLVIPIANNTRLNRHFLTLYYNAETNKLTIYDSKKQSLLSTVSNFGSRFNEDIKSSLKLLGIENPEITRVYLDFQQDSYSCGHWTAALSIAIAKHNHRSDLTKEEVMLAKNAIARAAKLRNRLQSYFAEYIGNEETLKANILRAMQGRGNIQYKGIDIKNIQLSDFDLNEFLDYLSTNNDSVVISSECRFLESKYYPGICETTRAQKIIFDSIIFELLAPGNLSDLLFFLPDENDGEIISRLKSQYKDDLEAYSRQCYVEIVNETLCKQPEIFSSSESSKLKSASSNFEQQAMKREYLDVYSNNTSFEIFKIAVKVTLAIALIAIIFVLVVAAIMHPAVVIPVAAVAGAGLVAYGGYKLFQCCSSFCDDGEIVHPETQRVENK